MESNPERRRSLPNRLKWGRRFLNIVKRLPLRIGKLFLSVFGWRKTKVHPEMKKKKKDDQKNSKDMSIKIETDYNVEMKTSISSDSSVSISLQAIPTKVLELPQEIRQQIYFHLSPKDVLSLRSTCRELNDDLNIHRGVHLRLNDSLNGYDWIKTFGLEALTIDQFDQTIPQNTALISNPSLLKRLIIRGTVSPENLEFLLSSCKYLETLEIECTQFNVRLYPNLFQRKLSIPENLKELKVNSYVHDQEGSSLVLQNLKSIFEQCKNCKSLKTFTLSVVLMGPDQDLDEYHLETLKFIRHHAPSLKKICIQIKQLLLDPGHLPRWWLRDDLGFSAWIDHLKLDELKLIFDRYIEEWKPLIMAQRNLKTLDLDLRNNNWIGMHPIFDNCKSSLRNLSISNIALPRSIGGEHESVPLDVESMKDCLKLEKLFLQHQNRSNPSIAATLSRSDEFPNSLKEIVLNYFVLKPHQELALLLKLPLLRKLTLGYWTDTESCLASFLTTLTFLIMFDLTSIQSFVLLELKRKMENRATEVTKMNENLKGKVKITQEDSVRESKLYIQRF